MGGEGERGGRGRREKKSSSRWNFLRLLYIRGVDRSRMIHALGLLGMERILGHRGDNTSLPRALIPT